jgi:hypothetical protein
VKRLLVFFPLLVILVACGESQVNNSSSIAAKPSPTVAPPHFYKVGETATIQPWEITLQSANRVDPATYLPSGESMPDANAGDQLLVLDEHVKNISSHVQPWSGTQIRLQNAAGNSDFHFLMVGKDIVGSISPTLLGSGQQAFMVPSDVHLFYWIYTSDDGLHQVIWQINV